MSDVLSLEKGVDLLKSVGFVSNGWVSGDWVMRLGNLALHHTKRQGSDIYIYYYSQLQFVGMRLLCLTPQRSSNVCIIQWGSMNCVLVDCNVHDETIGLNLSS